MRLSALILAIMLSGCTAVKSTPGQMTVPEIDGDETALKIQQLAFATVTALQHIADVRVQKAALSAGVKDAAAAKSIEQALNPARGFDQNVVVNTGFKSAFEVCHLIAGLAGYKYFDRNISSNPMLVNIRRKNVPLAVVASDFHLQTGHLFSMTILEGPQMIICEGA